MFQKFNASFPLASVKVSHNSIFWGDFEGLTMLARGDFRQTVQFSVNDHAANQYFFTL